MGNSSNSFQCSVNRLFVDLLYQEMFIYVDNLVAYGSMFKKAVTVLRDHFPEAGQGKVEVENYKMSFLL